MKIHVYAVGDKIEKFYLDAIKDYEKRISRYCKIQFVHLKNEKHLVKKFHDKSYHILVSTKGTTISSEELAIKINHLSSTGISEVSIIIGIDNEQYNDVWTLSHMEMDHGLKATLLLEQIYRAFTIIHNHPYHK